MSATLMLKIGLQIVTPVVALTLMGSVISTIIDSGGFIFSTKSLTPNFSKFNPAEGLKKMFTLRNLIELIKGLVKIIILFVCVYLIIRRYSNDTFWSPTCGIGCVAGVTLVLTGWIAAIGIMILLVSASLDLLISRWLFKRDNMMTLTEIKREQKEQFGDPHVRSARRADRQRMAQAAPLIGFNKANLIMVGPGGAVAITYKPEILGVPVVSAKTSAEGIGDFRTRAAERGLPVIEDAETTAELLKGGRVGDPIPRSTFTNVARALLRSGAGK
jgi:type III secretion protein U